tara:strand:+ start:1726 stop:2499 length:774 start_codon:yes stop_codon:yes gene_type:complete
MNIVNTDNYNSKLDASDNVMFVYNQLLNEYLSHITNHLVIKDNIHYQFVVDRGFDLFKNIFVLLLHYTKNLELVAHHIRKSYLYYTEFIAQVGEDSNSFLQLNSKDACLFVYKKTVYDIDFKKKCEMSENEIKMFFNLKENIYLFTKIIKLFCKKNVDCVNNFMINNEAVKNIKQFMVKISFEINKLVSNYDKIHNFVDYINIKIFDCEKIYHLIYHFIKKINITEISDVKVYTLLLDDQDYVDLTPIKFINKLFRK